MTSTVPTVRQLSWLAIIPQLILIGLFTWLYHLNGSEMPFLLGALTYSFLALLLRKIIAKQHRQGIRLARQQKFAEAIPHFEKSVAYFTRNNWVDKYRFVTLLSSSRGSYREMGLCNIAFCYSQTGNGAKAKEYYELALKDFPESGLAIAGLNMLNSTDRN